MSAIRSAIVGSFLPSRVELLLACLSVDAVIVCDFSVSGSVVVFVVSVVGSVVVGEVSVVGSVGVCGVSAVGSVGV